MKEKMTIKEAAQYWVRGFNAIPQQLIVKAYGGDNIDELIELTPISSGDIVWSNEHQGTFEVLSIDHENEKAVIEVDGEEMKIDINNLIPEKDDLLPMWNTMWTFENSLDEDWARNNLQTMADCGFRIYESDELGIYFGIDGAGYDFYEVHWIPLYKARGLQWHNEV